MAKEKIFTIACIGCGARGQMYSALAAEMCDKFKLTAAADPVTERVNKIKQLSGNNEFKSFKSADELLMHPKLADILIIATQDSFHYSNCRKAIELGYDILLEKPVAVSMKEILDLEKYAVEKNVRVMVCYVLRFSPFYQKVKEVIESGILGRIVTVNFTSGVSPWRMAHSFVRGHWSDASKATPMIVAKACHDTDIIQWLLQKKCNSISSYGTLNHYTKENAPQGAPERCTDGCNLSGLCIYDSARYLSDMKFPWLPQIYDNALLADDNEILHWLKTSPWGRCVYKCDNNAPDHQVVAMKFEGGTTCTFTMTAFESGRNIEIYGTEGVLKGGEAYRRLFNSEITVITHAGNVTRHSLTNGTDAAGLRMERDRRLIESLYKEMSKPAGETIDAGITDSMQSHIIAFAAEEARLKNEVIDIPGYLNRINGD